MNMKELEAIVLRQQALLDALQSGMADLAGRVNLLEKATNAEDWSVKLGARCDTLEAVTKELHRRIEATQEQADSLQTGQSWLRSAMAGVQDKSEMHSEKLSLHDTMLEEMKPQVDHVTLLVDSRNRSAPTKRNMTDQDAIKCLTGEFKDLSHKDAGEKMGLTYSQVYSCRLEFTFKEVHKKLRESGWKNPFKG